MELTTIPPKVTENSAGGSVSIPFTTTAGMIVTWEDDGAIVIVCDSGTTRLGHAPDTVDLNVAPPSNAGQELNATTPSNIVAEENVVDAPSVTFPVLENTPLNVTGLPDVVMVPNTDSAGPMVDADVSATISVTPLGIMMLVHAGPDVNPPFRVIVAADIGNAGQLKKDTSL